jgi:predicted nucleic acid-binding Zn ribbon protein
MTGPGGDEASESRAVFERFRRVFGDGSSRSRDARKRRTREPGSSTAFGPGRDAQGLADVLDALTTTLGWNSPLAQSELLASWTEIAGAETAEHSQPVGIDDGLLTVRCDSTAWATQLRLMRAEITTRIDSRYPEAGIRSIRFEGPGAPSWKRGPKSVPGRGPRDTYG